MSRKEMFSFKHSLKVFPTRWKSKCSNFAKSFCSFQKVRFTSHDVTSDLDSDDEMEKLLNDPEYRDNFKDNLPGRSLGSENAYVIQPWIKWGPDKLRNTTPQLLLDETVTLAETLPNFRVLKKEVITGTYFKKPTVLGKGNLERIAGEIHSSGSINCAVFGMNQLTAKQQRILEERLGIKVYDRYAIVLRIFLERACTKEARIQTALAEIPYIRSRLRFLHENSTQHQNLTNQIGGIGEKYFLQRKEILEERERKLIRKLNKLEQSKEMQNCTRQKHSNIPVVAVVGYTNSGKTSLIKYMTKDDSLVPRDQLFATLDISYHKGRLASGQHLFFMDTIGFISNIPTGLISAFNATLKEILRADLVLHVYDVSHPDLQRQRETVDHTLKERIKLPEKLLSTMMEVGNKIDLLKDEQIDQLLLSESSQKQLWISLTDLINVKDLKEMIEQKIHENIGRRRRRVRVQSGGKDYSWLIKNAVMLTVQVDNEDANFLVIDLLITEKLFNIMSHMFPNVKTIQ